MASTTSPPVVQPSSGTSARGHAAPASLPGTMLTSVLLETYHVRSRVCKGQIMKEAPSHKGKSVQGANG